LPSSFLSFEKINQLHLEILYDFFSIFMGHDTLGVARPLHGQHSHIVASRGNIDERKQAGFDPVQQFACGIKGLLDQ